MTQRRSMKNRNRENGFILIATLIAMFIIMGVGILAYLVSTSDFRTSSRVMADKRTLAAAQTGLYQFMNTFDPLNPSASAGTFNVAGGDLHYTIATPTQAGAGPDIAPVSGAAIGGGQSWGLSRYTVTITSNDSGVGTSAEFQIGVGYGPIEITTMYR